jgi:hypothetical protein
MECDKEIKRCAKPIQEEIKQTYMIDDDHELIFGKKGAFLLKTLKDGSTPVTDLNKAPLRGADSNLHRYKPIKKDTVIDLELLKQGKYTLDDLIDANQNNTVELGMYEGTPMFLKNGKYGKYVEWGDKKESIKGIDDETITLEKVTEYLQGGKRKENVNNKSILRVINNNLSIRHGKFGPYLFYSPENAKKPEFYPIKKFKENVATCEISAIIQWIQENYPDKNLVDSNKINNIKL